MYEANNESRRELRARWDEAQAQETRRRARDFARDLGVPEAALADALAEETGGVLRNDWEGLVKGLCKVGKVMALARNEAIVLENSGEYDEVSFFHGGVGQVLGRGIDLRVYTRNWHRAVHLDVMSRGQALKSIQIYDRAGQAIQKIYAKDYTDSDAFGELIASLSDPSPEDLRLEPEPVVAAPRTREELSKEEIEKLCNGWDALQDTHDFFMLLREVGLGRLEALRAAGPGRAERVAYGSFERVLESAAGTGFKILMFVENPGIHQIHGGPIERIVRMDDWFNIMDPDFNLHLDTKLISEVWCVRKPTRQGIVTSLELYDGDGKTAGMLFSKKGRDEAETEAWREMVASGLQELPQESMS